MDEFEFYNKHYITVDDRGRVTAAWSDGPMRGKDVTGAVCINDKGGYQLRLTVDGKTTEENPPIRAMDGIPLYKYVDGEIKRRTQEEIEADRAKIPAPPPSPLEQLRADVDFVMVMADLM